MYSRGDREREPQRGVEGEAKRRDECNRATPSARIVNLSSSGHAPALAPYGPTRGPHTEHVLPNANASSNATVALLQLECALGRLFVLFEEAR